MSRKILAPSQHQQQIDIGKIVEPERSARRDDDQEFSTANEPVENIIEACLLNPSFFTKHILLDIADAPTQPKEIKDFLRPFVAFIQGEFKDNNADAAIAEKLVATSKSQTENGFLKILKTQNQDHEITTEWEMMQQRLNSVRRNSGSADVAKTEDEINSEQDKHNETAENTSVENNYNDGDNTLTKNPWMLASTQYEWSKIAVGRIPHNNAATNSGNGKGITVDIVSGLEMGLAIDDVAYATQIGLLCFPDVDDNQESGIGINNQSIASLTEDYTVGEDGEDVLVAKTMFKYSGTVSPTIAERERDAESVQKPIDGGLKKRTGHTGKLSTKKATRNRHVLINNSSKNHSSNSSSPSSSNSSIGMAGNHNGCSADRIVRRSATSITVTARPHAFRRNSLTNSYEQSDCEYYPVVPEEDEEENGESARDNTVVVLSPPMINAQKPNTLLHKLSIRHQETRKQRAVSAPSSSSAPPRRSQVFESDEKEEERLQENELVDDDDDDEERVFLTSPILSVTIDKKREGFGIMRVRDDEADNMA
ncbi:hypothetical protein HK100_004142 [Physocladia obscura]|uniref:Uncharacterized protein n=1 Tax=Physocladia obscura TaxID=109957 RepID=A0AAD5XA23_9FUNG|nr:hypothetical protein HK100_004142 [Physocladia obscura]